MEARERQRERETIRYYDLYSVVHEPHEPPPSNHDARPQRRPLAASQDTALTCFAQLCSLRLNARRCLISLFDTHHQYVIAEATGSLPIRPDSSFTCGDDDRLWLCGTILDRGEGFCERVLEGQKQAGASEVGSVIPESDLSGSAVDGYVCVIPDLTTDARCKDMPWIYSYPYNKFYAGCPIRTSRGVDIGVLSIYDTKPRPQGLTPAEMEILVDVSRTIMRHLEANRARLESRRSERMVRGIGSFVEGSATLAGWWSNLDTASHQHISVGEATLNTAQQELAQQASVHPESGHDLTPAELARTEGIETFDMNKPHQTDTGTQKLQVSPKGGSSANHTVDHVASNGQQVSPPVEAHSRAIESIFARAANIIRESLEIEGVAFFDARISSFGGLVDARRRDSNSSHSEDSDASSKSTNRIKNKHTGENEKVCRVLAFATSDGSTINNASEDGTYKVPESFLKAFLRRYPTGKIFNFDDSGQARSSESEESADSLHFVLAQSGSSRDHRLSPSQKRKKVRRSKVNDAADLQRLIPGAKSAMFFPLWDSTRQRWYGGAIAWTRTGSRPFSARGELSYLSAFGNTIMSQVARLDALVVENAKADLLGSISHEMRSPLHGILGGVEMLADTTINPFQNDVLHTIETCGKTLLDVMDHLLDFAKINNLFLANNGKKIDSVESARDSTLSHDSSQYPIGTDLSGLAADVELDILAEEVIESVYAGQQYYARIPDNFQDSLVKREITEYHAGIAVILDIEYSDPLSSVSVEPVADNWCFHLAPGGIRRILMNIFGNALKYTSRGTVRVSLSRSNKPHSPTRSEFSSDAKANMKKAAQEVILRISDTGSGMSTEFMDNYLFAPFSQEDPLKSGTGLGLSITQQIVKHLGGTINVSSKVGLGSEFTVRLPLLKSDRCATPEIESTSDNGKLLRDHIKATQGLRVAFFGFADQDELQKKQDGILRTRELPTSPVDRKEEWSLPRREIERICRLRLAMDVLPTPKNEKELLELVPRPEVLLTTERHVKHLLDGLIQSLDPRSAGSLPAIVVVCQSTAMAKRLSKEHDPNRAVVDFISQPCGPRKLAEAFALSVTRWSEQKDWLKVESLTPKIKPSQPGSLPHDSPSINNSVPALESLRITDASSSKQELTFDFRKGKESYLLVEDNIINMRVRIPCQS
ncbi:hypothetical protein, variant [Verruconis gallopava]|uniref:histidine kinase n=1 Tax=Verruconis gallopava TaxID=253628 RepID=A0A0D2A7G3_9PEZI|nr:hypothetical protein, variant [Verruconis gallopava]KIW02480.1 hypothetical protein, variant [Verruconis gallopava]